ncbi:hypothetical protein B1C78_03640 [Thioalkalivibrio denitrificans]|uniref:TIGR03016 family PEP-CTERM system-associated outer membrane protein n=1 Tax=Thioalkalivibrio denitrificans TaxID=108003 RepID=A0A1V3NQZ3_9GAMM|nr:TIGR03016 family PEP-CTERM system-associated outer membrane protein [Thioalkalivibrio denitrificans]OOG27242.1 hypothetical protein B1C78_03640 [Thioalkalivibrio denitrificans]
MSVRRRALPLAVSCALSMAWAVPVMGDDPPDRWDFSPRVSISQIYTDNVGRASPGNERDDLITELNTGITASRQGARARARLGYNLRSQAYWDEDSRNRTTHQFSGDGRVDLLPERFFVDGAATYRQRTTSLTDLVADNLTDDDQLTDVFTLSVAPTFVHRFGSAATAQATYGYDRVDYIDSSVQSLSSETNRVAASLNSGPAFTRVGWGLSFQRTETDYDDGSSVTFQIAEALVRLNVTRRFSVFAAGGEEDNDFEQDPTRARPDDTFWRAGATWQGARTSMEAFYGERFFGKTYGGSFDHRFRNSRFSMSYTESPTTLNRVEFDEMLLVVFDEFGEVVDIIPVLVPNLESGVYLQRRFTAGFTGSRRKTDWGIRVFDEQREFEVTDERERIQGISGNVGWLMAPRTRLLLNASVQERSFNIDDRDDIYYIFGIGASREITANTSASVNYQYLERDSDAAGADYTENRLTATFRASF